MKLIPARALIGALTPEEARAIAAPDSWPWPMSEDAERWMDQFVEPAVKVLKKRFDEDAARAVKSAQPEAERQFDQKAHDDFMKQFR